MIKKYRFKPNDIEAVQYTDETFDEVVSMLGGYSESDATGNGWYDTKNMTIYKSESPIDESEIYVKTHTTDDEGEEIVMLLWKGEWLIKTGNNYQIFSDDFFNHCFEEVK